MTSASRLVRIGGIAAVLCILVPVITSAGQLPPQVQADANLLRVEQAVGAGNFEQAWAALQDAGRLRMAHDLDLPDFDYWYGRVAHEMGLSEEALTSITNYLSRFGRDARHYGEALALLNTLQVTVTCGGWNAVTYFEAATLEQVRACLETGSVDLHALNASGLTPLHAAAAQTAEPAIIQTLLDAGAPVDATDEATGATPLSLALRDNGNQAIIKMLLDAGANPEAPNANGLTPLHLAAAHADDPVVYEIFLTARSGLTTPDQVLEGTERSIEILIDAGADPKHLEQALESMMKDLMAAGVDAANDAAAQALMDTVQVAVLCEEWNTDAYFEAAAPEVVTACLDAGAVDLEARSASGLTPLQAAARDAHNPAVIEALLAAGADPIATHSQVESGLLGEGDSFRSNGSYQDSYTLGLAGNVIVDLRSDDFDTYLVVKSPSGLRFVSDDYQGDNRRSKLSILLDEVGEYQVLVSSYYTFESGPYTLHVTKGEAPVYYAARYNENPAVIDTFLRAGVDPNGKREDGFTLLHAASQSNGNPEVIESLLAAGANVREKDEYGRTPLHIAAGHNEDLAAVESLLAAGANVREDDDNDRTPLHFAARDNENSAIVEALLAAGANLEEGDDNGYRALHLAASTNENVAVAQALLDAGAELRPSAGPYRNTPLRLAAMSNENPAVTQVLIEAGAEVNDGTFSSGDTALHYAAWSNGNPDVVGVLLMAGATLEVRNDERSTPLHFSARNDNPAVIEALLAVGASLEVRNDDGYTPLHYAAGNDNPAVIEALLSAGVSLEVRNDDGYTPLHRAARYNENPDVVEALVAAGASLEVRNDDDYTPLHSAARYNANPAVAEALLAAGVSLEVRNDDGYTPLHSAARYSKNPVVIDALLAAGSSIEALESGDRTPLYLAAQNNTNPAVLEALIAAGADPMTRERAGITPLHAAADRNSNPAVMAALLRAGASLEALDDDGRTPLYWATEVGDNEAAREFLLQAGAGQTERERAAERARREANSGPGFLEAAIAIAGGTAIAAAGGATEEALAAGADFAESVIGEQAAAGRTASAPVTLSTGNVGVTSSGARCEIPNYPSPPNVQTLGLSWCGSSVSLQRRAFALQAAGAQCAIATRSSSTPEQINARRQEIQAACGRLDAMQSPGIPTCQCPAGLGSSLERDVASGGEEERARAEERQAQEEARRREREERQRQAAENKRIRLEENNRSILASDCSCISIDEPTGEYSCLDGFVVGNDCSGEPLCDIRR